ncbi:NUDIX hydrolase domain-like protein [Phialemonium atrogriseum]|uniref:NUDIX hydrolase domain-like protein n=1 Tax=Phialemonium atrogriseum TaxID=1093897 RepID=A0AAJ0BYS0_9PEZI|nr:NUDIX hydrolase domain-like protein [Phialemonium atrogriseum]KAK1766780.1 NUDIX hydrolase domain-like protein [Phialemonium atrogriseum]
MAKRLTSLDLINKCDAFPDPVKDPKGYAARLQSLYTLVWEDAAGAVPIGYMPRSVFETLLKTPVSVKGELDFNAAKGTVTLFHQPETEPERTKLVANLTDYWRQKGTFRILKGWRDELWPVYDRRGNVLFSMERSAMGLFGTMRYGVHLTAFVRQKGDDSEHDMRIWVPKRSTMKTTYPGMLDNTVAGGLMTDEDPFECMIREADEEASLPEDVVRNHAKHVGTVTYIYITDERSGGEDGLIYPECQWVYDLELPADQSVTPEPKDGEVESFSLCTVEEIQEQLAQGRWKPNCALVMLDFFVRHGILTRENDPNYDEIRRRVHREMPFPGPHQALR